MFRRVLAPIVICLVSFLLDTAIIPAFYYGRFLVPVTLIAAMSIAVSIGRMQGLLYGSILGLLTDITAGTPGFKLLPYAAICFVYGFFLDHDRDITDSTNAADRRLAFVRREVWAFILYAVFEVVMLMFQYFNNAVWEWSFVLNLFIRTGEFCVLMAVFFPLLRRVLLGKIAPEKASGVKREMKKY